MESLLEKPKYSGMRASPVTHTLLSWFFLFSWFSSLSWFFLFSSVFPFQFSLFSSLSCWRFSPPFTPSSAFPVNLSQDEIPGALPAASHPSSFPSFILPVLHPSHPGRCCWKFLHLPLCRAKGKNIIRPFLRQKSLEIWVSPCSRCWQPLLTQGWAGKNEEFEFGMNPQPGILHSFGKPSSKSSGENVGMDCLGYSSLVGNGND